MSKADVAAAIKAIDKKFGGGTLAMLGDTPNQDVEVISSGSIGLDKALGVGGLPRGRIVEIYGPESSGKTTLCIEAIAQCQKAGGTAAFIDAEHAFDPLYATHLGVDINKLIFSQPSSGEEALQIVDELTATGICDMICVDSVSALTPKAEIKGEIGDSHIGLQARMMSQGLRKIAPEAKRTDTMIIFINQIRIKIGVMFGSPETTSGGNALKFYASVRLDIRRIGRETDKDTGEITANQTRVKVIKNKVAAPFKQAEFLIIYNVGISTMDELIDFGIKSGEITQAGSWFSMGDLKLGQGRGKVAAFLEENPEVYDDLYNAVTQK